MTKEMEAGTVQIRAAVPGDAEGIGRVHVDSWRETYQGIVPDQVLDELSYEQRTMRARELLEKSDPGLAYFVATHGEDIVGFSAAGKMREGRPGYEGELYAIYLLKKNQGVGLGKALFYETTSWFTQRGYSSFLVWVLRDNPSAQFYEATGGLPLDEKIITIGKPLHEVSYGWQLSPNHSK